MTDDIAVSHGRYRHYKGKEYTLVGIARHSETLEELVVYRPEYGEQGLWVRPKAMFFESVTINGREVPRFQFLGSTPNPDREAVKNLLADLPAQLPAEIVQTLVSAAGIRIERIVSFGQASPDGSWYDQTQHEWVLLLKGAARLHFEGDDQSVEMQSGDAVHIPAHTRHRVEWTAPDEPTVWLAVFYGESH